MSHRSTAATRILLLAALSAAAYFARHLPDQHQSAPQTAQSSPSRESPNDWKLTILENKGYSVGYSEILKNPVWVKYSLDWSQKNPEPMTRPKTPFIPDPRTKSRVKTDDFTRSGFSRGHMAPSFAIGAFHGRDAQLETFQLSNIVPQNQTCNDGVWNSIERMEADDFTKRFGQVDVTDGPVFEKQPPDRLPAGIAIPTGFYKVIKRPDGQAIAFLVPQNPPSPKPEAYLASPNEIQAITGIDFGLSPQETARKRTKIW